MTKIYQKTFPGQKNAGFTLIELLVFVLIVVILAAVALPQYQKAVLKSRMNSMWSLLKGIKDAQEIYYMANGSYTDDLTQLDVALPKGEVHFGESVGQVAYSNGTCIDNISSPTSSNGWLVRGGVGSNCWTSFEDSCLFHVYFDNSDYPGRIACSGPLPHCTEVCKSFSFVTQ